MTPWHWGADQSDPYTTTVFVDEDDAGVLKDCKIEVKEIFMFSKC